MLGSPTHSKLAEFFRYLERHRIYLPDALGRQVQDLAMKVREHVINFSVFVRYAQGTLNEQADKQKTEAWTKGAQALREHVPTLRRALEDEFRVLLGDRLEVQTVVVAPPTLETSAAGSIPRTPTTR